MTTPFDFFNRVLNPTEAARNNNPSRTPNQTRRRNNARNPNLPRDGEGLRDFVRRTGISGANSVAGAVERRTVDPQQASSNERLDRVQGARESFTPADPGLPAPMNAQIIAGAMILHNNMPSTRLLDIPMGHNLLGPDMERPNRRLEEGRIPAIGYTYDSKSREIGLIRWGVDQRRAPAEIIRDVERNTGAPDGYLRRLSGQESGNNVDARPGTSSASGFFQITSPTWDDWVFGNKYYPELGRRFREQYGLTQFDDEEMRDYRRDARVDGAIATEIARHSHRVLQDNGLQRITEGDLYMGHFGGDAGLNIAIDRSRGRYRHRYGHQYFSEAEVNANINVFFDGGSRTRPRTAQQVYERLTEQFGDREAVFRQRADGSNNDLTQ